MTWTEKDGFKLIENQLNANDADTVAVANFTNAINETGGSFNNYVDTIYNLFFLDHLPRMYISKDLFMSYGNFCLWTK